MKRTIVLLLIALFAVMALSAASKNTGMDISKCENSTVVSFVNFLIDTGIMDANFPEYGVYQNSHGIYYLSLILDACDYGHINLFFCDDHVEFYWNSGIFLDDYKGKYDETFDVFQLAMACIADYLNQYVNWAAFSCQGNPDEMYAMSSLLYDGFSSQKIAEAIWVRLRKFIIYSEDGFDDVKKNLIEHYNTYK